MVLVFVGGLTLLFCLLGDLCRFEFVDVLLVDLVFGLLCCVVDWYDGVVLSWFAYACVFDLLIRIDALLVIYWCFVYLMMCVRLLIDFGCSCFVVVY